jgi:cell division protein FtsW
MVTRADRGAFAEWWWTVDRYLLLAVLVLMAGGIVLSFAASPPVADRLGVDTYHFVQRQAFFAVPAVAVLIGISLLSPAQVRLVAVGVFVVAFLLTVATLFFGAEVKGSTRWISFLGMSVQPSEFLKPAFVILVAALFAEGAKRREVPGKPLAALLLAMVLAPLVAQPDFGQAMLIAIVWGALFFLAGLSWFLTLLLAGFGAAGLIGAYFLLPHVASRINRFLNPDSADNFQVETAIESFVSGGWLGRGPGEGTVKLILPDSHTDFVFAVTAEEFGILACGLIVLGFAFVVIRGLRHAEREHDMFVRLATSGLLVLFGVQACINMAVNLHLMPAKGMTLPFISDGGSSLIAVALGMGFILALTRRRPRVDAVLPRRPFPLRERTAGRQRPAPS